MDSVLSHLEAQTLLDDVSAKATSTEVLSYKFPCPWVASSADSTIVPLWSELYIIRAFITEQKRREIIEKITSKFDREDEEVPVFIIADLHGKLLIIIYLRL